MEKFVTDDQEEPWEEQLVAIELVGMIDPDKLNMVKASNTAVLVQNTYFSYFGAIYTTEKIVSIMSSSFYAEN